jgi:ParB family chromosome partitioning protein
MAKKTKTQTQEPEATEPQAIRLKNYFSVPLDKIQANPEDNGRWFGDPDSDEGIAELASGIAQVGLQQALQATDNGDGTYRLRFGFRRFAALCQIRDAGLFGEGFFYPVAPDAKVEVVKVEDKEALLHNVEENFGRCDPGPMGEASICNQLVNTHKMTHGEVAKFMRQSDSWVTQRLALLSLPVKLQRRIQSREIGSVAGYELAGMDSKLRNKVIANLDARSEKVTLGSIRQEAAALGAAT